MPAFTIVSGQWNANLVRRPEGESNPGELFCHWFPPCQQELADGNRNSGLSIRITKTFQAFGDGREHTDAELEKNNEGERLRFPLYPDKNRAIFGWFAKKFIRRSYLIERRESDYR